MTKPDDIGDYLHVPQSERLDEDPAPEYNADSGFDVQVVPDGEVRELSTADEAEDGFDEDEEFDDASDGAPLQFIEAGDPELEKYEEEGE